MKLLARAARLALPVAVAACSTVPPEQWRSVGEVLEQASASDWRAIPPEELLYLRLGEAEIVIRMAPLFAPRHIDNLRLLVDAGHFSPAHVVRSQDNYVAQWDGDGPIGDAAAHLEPEFYRDAAGLPFTPLDSRDAYAAEVGFVDGFPVGRDGTDARAWLTHCYGMVGAGRDNDPGSGNAGELYVVTGHAPRHLDRNVTLLGRVIAGMEHLSTLPRGSGALGFYSDDEQTVPLSSVRFGDPADQPWETLRTDTATFSALVESRRFRHEQWFVDPAGAIGLCNVPLPVRPVAAP